MRKHQQHQILELIQTLGEAQSLGMLASCRDCARQISGFIQHIEGENGGARTIALLEEYRELLLRAENGKIGPEPLQDQLARVENSVNNELKPNRIEIAFLSYNASMADSIESIYLAAKADPDCDAYWIPIPYFERKTDGSFGEMRYQGADCYSANIECTDWHEYDIEARHPDVIFTFAPYDAENYVTSVHPAFYCERLRGLTDLLCYVPYFVVPDDVAEHFATLAGCVYAHKVIVQSEKVRDTYIRVFREQYGDSLGRPEDKFVALGSPKFDKAINARREDFTLPDQWRELIGGRKVILYNTSVGAILQGNEQYLKKLKSVLDTFRTRDDTALWWRPHPLNEATYKSMRPQLLEEYERIVAEYRRDGWGIYDDTPDLHRAIAWTDGYYGDMSSLVTLYQVTGKPVMAQNTESARLDGGCDLILDDVHDDGSCYWFASLTFNALFRMDKATWKPEYMGSFPREKTGDVWRLYSAMTAYGDKLIFAPSAANEIAEYDKSTGIFRKIPLPPPPTTHKEMHEKILHTPYFHFIAATQRGNLSFFIPNSFPAIVRYNADTGVIDCFDDWMEPLSVLLDYDFTPKSTGYFWRGICVVGSKILVAALNSNAVLEFDMENCASVVREVGSKCNQYIDICFDGRSYWLAPRHDGPVVRWDAETGECREFDELPAGCGTNFSFIGCEYANGFVWMLPALGNAALKIDPATEEISIAEEFQAECGREFGAGESERYPNRYFSIRKTTTALLAYAGRSGLLVEYRPETKELRKESPRLSSEDAKALARMLFAADTNVSDDSDRVFYESGISPLGAYLKYVISCDAQLNALREKRKKFRGVLAENLDGSAGRAIYDDCKNTAI
jgi:hypothetical protein